MIESYIIIGLCLLIVLSYCYNLIARHLRIPSVLLLLGTGVLCRYIATYYGFNIQIPTSLISIFGSVGLIFIVLEGMLDIKFAKSKLRIIGSAFLVCIFLIACSTAGISWLIVYYKGATWHNALLYGISLSIISSAIVIPTVEKLSQRTKEFMLYESTLSDIIGILAFNLIVYNEVDKSITPYVNLGWQMLLMLLVAVVFSLLMIWFMARIKTRVRFYLIIALMILVYESGNLLHISSLLLIMCFGLVLNNINLLYRYLLRSRHSTFVRAGEKMSDISQQAYNNIEGFKFMVLESSFIIRTFFFFMFGYSIDVNGIFQPQTLLFSSYILAIMYMLRFINLKFLTRTPVFPEIFIYPRGSTTVLLYYSIPLADKISDLNGGILFTIIILSNILMMIGVMFSKKEDLIVEEEVF